MAELGFVLVELAAPAKKLALVGRHFEFIKDGVHWADRLAVGAIGARLRVDVVHLFFIRGGDAAHGTDINARSVLNPDAGFGDYESQSVLLLVVNGRSYRRHVPTFC